MLNPKLNLFTLCPPDFQWEFDRFQKCKRWWHYVFGPKQPKRRSMRNYTRINVEVCFIPNLLSLDVLLPLANTTSSKIFKGKVVQGIVQHLWFNAAFPYDVHYRTMSFFCLTVFVDSAQY